jgi:putative phosphoribosyl transferase
LAACDEEADFAAACRSEFAEIERGLLYLGGRERRQIAGCTLATGATTRAALRATRLRHPKHLVLAVPGATESLAKLRHR